ncbi:hypothetical protein D3C72_1906060 [compost metagenome]
MPQTATPITTAAASCLPRVFTVVASHSATTDTTTAITADSAITPRSQSKRVLERIAAMPV